MASVLSRGEGDGVEVVVSAVRRVWRVVRFLNQIRYYEGFDSLLGLYALSMLARGWQFRKGKIKIALPHFSTRPARFETRTMK